MLMLDQGMQQRLSNSWQLDCNGEYAEAMADEGDGTGITSSSAVTIDGSIGNGGNNNAINSTNGGSGPGSIVNSLLLKKTGAFFSESPGSGLEQKIKELKAEKEAGEIKKCPGSLNDQDSPLDFSVKRRSSFSGSLSDDSQGSSCSPPNTGDYSGMSPPPHTDFRNAMNDSEEHNGDVSVKTEIDTYYEDHTPDIGQPKVSPLPSMNNLPPLLNCMNVLPGMTSSLLTNGSAMNNISQVISAASKINEHRNNRKNSRPFKAYPKEALQLPLGFLGMPGFAALQQGLESGIFSGMNSDDIMTLYNQQLQLFREKQQHSSSTGSNSGKNSPSSQISSTTSSMNSTPNTNMNGHHQHQQPPLLHEKNSHSLNHHSPPHPSTTKHQMNSPGAVVPTSPPHLPPHSHNSPPHFSPSHHHNHHHRISPDHLTSNGFVPPTTTPNTNTSINCNPNTNHFPVPPPPHLSHPANSNNSNSSSSIHASNNTLVSSTSSASTSPYGLLGQSNNSNCRKRPRSLPDDQKDDAYWERRRKNNDAAKRSRDARRAKEDEIALRAALLEQENLKLRVEVAALKTETARLRCMLYNT